MAIIERISFSRENEQGDSDWADNLGTFGCIVRNIVSDADKLTAIGVEGLERCKEYTIEKYLMQYKVQPTDDYVKQNMIKHYHDKLSKLAAYYIRTDPGKRRAGVLDIEMNDFLFMLKQE